MRALVLTAIGAALAALSLSAQGRAATDRPVDRIVAVVGTKPILASQVEEQLVLAQSQGAKVPADSAGGGAPPGPNLSPEGGEEGPGAPGGGGPPHQEAGPGGEGAAGATRPKKPQ